MLHSKKSQSILQWYNSLTAKGDVNSLEQFTDGSHFYEIVASLQPLLLQGNKEGNLAAESVIFSETSIACNEEVITSVEEEAATEEMETSVSECVNADPFVVRESDHTDTQKKYDVIRKFIDDFYHLESASLIDYGECQKGKELELAKVAVFLLSAMVQNLLSSEDKVVYNTTLLEPEVQENIRECLALVLVEKDTGENQIKKSELHKVLSRAASYKATPVRKQPSRSIPDLNDLSEGVKNVPKKRKEKLSVFEDPPESPLKSLLDSPNIQYKVAVFRLESQLKKFRNAFHSEENKVADLTLEKKNLNDELEKRKKELEFYKKSYRETLREKEEQEKLRDEELENKKIESEKVRKLIESQQEEIKQLKESNDALQEKIVDLEKKLEQVATTSLIEENNNLKDNIQMLELGNKHKDESIKKLNEKIANTEKDLKKYQQIVHDNSASNSRWKRSPNVSETSSHIIYADDQSFRETLGRKELEMKRDPETKVERIKRPVESKSASTPDMSVPTDLNSIKKEIDMIESTNVSESSSKSDSKMRGQLQGDVSNSQNSRTDSKTCNFKKIDKTRFKIIKDKLEEIVHELDKPQGVEPDLKKALIFEFSDKMKTSDQFCSLLSSSKVLSSSKQRPAGVETRSRSQATEEVAGLTKNLGQKNRTTKRKSKTSQINSDETECELKKAIEDLQTSNVNKDKDLDNLRKEVVIAQEEVMNLRQEVAIAQEKYINMEKLAKKKDEDVKKALIMYQRIVKLDKKDKDSKNECGEEYEKLLRKYKQRNKECLEYEEETGNLKRSIKNLEGMMEHLRFEIKELKKEKRELQHKLWEETSALSKNTTDRDALVLHYLKKSRHEPKNIDLELKKEDQKKSSRPIVKVDAYILNSENDQSTSNSVLASRSIRSSFFQVADEDDFLNESSLAEIHNGVFPEGESGDHRLLELQRRNTLCPPHLQSSYPLEIQNMTPSERKYYDPEEVSFDLGRKSSLYNAKKDKRPMSKYMESDSDDSDYSHSCQVKKRKISETDRIFVPVSKKHYHPSSSVAKGPSKEQGNLRKPSTPLKRVAAFVKKQSASFKTPSSVHRLMRLPRKSKIQ